MSHKAQQNQAKSTQTANKPLSSAANLTKTDVEILQYAHFYHHAFRRTYFSQDRVARKVGCSRKTVNEAMGKFAQLGLCLKEFRLFDTCIYDFSPLFKNQFLTRVMSVVLPFIIALPLSAKAPSRASFQEKVTPHGLYYLNLSSGSQSLFEDDAGLRIKKEKETSNPEKRPIKPMSEYIAHGLKMAFSEKQRIKLSIFPDHVLQKVYFQYWFRDAERYGKINDEYRWFYKACYTESLKQHIKLDWQNTKALLKERYYTFIEDSKSEGYES